MHKALMARGNEHSMKWVKSIHETMIAVITAVHDCSEGANRLINLGQKWKGLKSYTLLQTMIL